MTDSEYEGEPVIRDKRRLDPVTGELRETDGGAASAQDTPPPGQDTPPPGQDTPPPGQDTPASPSAESVDWLAAAKAEAADLFDQLQRAKADHYNLDSRFNSFVKRSRVEAAAERARGVDDVLDALIPVLDDIEYARAHGELEGPFLAIAEKLEGTLRGRFAVERFGASGDVFDPNLHEALIHETSADVATDTVSLVLQPGYRVGERIVRPARVSVTGPA